MRRGITLLTLLLAGCAPDFSPFTVIEPGEDGGPRMDAGAVDAGDGDAGGGDEDAGPGPIDGATDAGRVDAGADAGGGGGGSVLTSVSSCDQVVGSALLQEEFDAQPIPFRNLNGSFRVESGHLVIEGGATRSSILESTAQFNDDFVSCADVELPARNASDTIHEMSHNLRGLAHGVTCYVDAVRDRVVMFSIDPLSNTLVAMQRPAWLGQAVELRMLIYLRGTVAHCEVQNLGTSDVVVLDGAYGGEMMPVRVNFDGMATEHIRVDRVVAGAPSAAARAELP